MREREPVHALPSPPPPPQARGPRRRGPALEAEGPPIRQLALTVYEERWLVGGIAALFLALAGAYLALATPIYAASMLVQVEDTRKTVAGLEDISAIFSDKNPAETEIALLRSQLILGPVVDGLGLDVTASPERPRLDALLARVNPRGDRPPAVRIAQLAVAEELEGEPLVLTIGEGGKYTLASGEGARPLLEGVAGQAAKRKADPQVELLVSWVQASPGTRFEVVKHMRREVIEELREQLRIDETGKGTGIIRISTEGKDAKGVAALVNAIGQTYLRHNVERKSAEAERTLAFLDTQLPEVKAKVERAEAALRAFQARKGTVSLSREAETMLDRSVDVEKELSKLELERTDLRQKFTEQHPAVVALGHKMDQLRASRSSVESRLRDLPATELESARITRDVKVTQQLYDVLLNKAQELRILRSGIVGNVRIIDPALAPRRPARPVRAQVIAIGLLLGLAGGVAAAFVRRALDEGADDPDEIEARTGVPVYVTIPHSEHEREVRGARARGPALAVVAPEDVSVESLRSLRTALQFALVDAPSNVIALSSPSPGVGKSFVSLNLALLLASAGRRVLLVDADLRRGRLHRAFGLPRGPGISDVVSGAAPAEAARRATGFDHLDLLSTGRIPPNPAELLASPRFQQLIAAASPHYEIVLVDTPPVLAVTDATLVARDAGVNLLVLRAGQHPMREIALAVKQFTQTGLQVHGAILNDARFTRHGFGRYGRYYEYRTEKQD